MSLDTEIHNILTPYKTGSPTRSCVELKSRVLKSHDHYISVPELKTAHLSAKQHLLPIFSLNTSPLRTANPQTSRSISITSPQHGRLDGSSMLHSNHFRGMAKWKVSAILFLASETTISRPRVNEGIWMPFNRNPPIRRSLCKMQQSHQDFRTLIRRGTRTWFGSMHDEGSPFRCTNGQMEEASLMKFCAFYWS